MVQRLIMVMVMRLLVDIAIEGAIAPASAAAADGRQTILTSLYSLHSIIAEVVGICIEADDNGVLFSSFTIDITTVRIQQNQRCLRHCI
ncbi:MAG: ABC-type sugar transport system substrate-binding protein [Bacillariaceae sp.]|jgi:ABC-type sugar transport system substrate-binding protein